MWICKHQLWTQHHAPQSFEKCTSNLTNESDNLVVNNGEPMHMNIILKLLSSSSDGTAFPLRRERSRIRTFAYTLPSSRTGVRTDRTPPPPIKKNEHHLKDLPCSLTTLLNENSNPTITSIWHAHHLMRNTRNKAHINWHQYSNIITRPNISVSMDTNIMISTLSKWSLPSDMHQNFFCLLVTY